MVEAEGINIVVKKFVSGVVGFDNHIVNKLIDGVWLIWGESGGRRNVLTTIFVGFGIDDDLI